MRLSALFVRLRYANALGPGVGSEGKPVLTSAAWPLGPYLLSNLTRPGRVPLCLNRARYRARREACAKESLGGHRSPSSPKSDGTSGRLGIEDEHD
jgi:hypothetical protein